MQTSNELTEGSVDGAVASAEHPHATGEAVVAEEWEVGGQHDQIGESKVHYQHTYLGIEIKVDNHAIAEDGDGTQEEIDNPKEVVPHGVDWGVVVPVLVDQRLQVIGHEVHHRHPIGEDNAISSSRVTRSG
ncbi:hypothetical protein E2C01_027342 [Portunus trituberculatus]|uniref:Uncharacterized protein n=1 Tax=Portunus trituberculatus TaxID=210409 RepID=A0A5B7ELP4_PORTR|nr:hypothetical protein [Portunus trituberculatus]